MVTGRTSAVLTALATLVLCSVGGDGGGVVAAASPPGWQAQLAAAQHQGLPEGGGW